MCPCVTSLFRTARAFQLTEWRKSAISKAFWNRRKPNYRPKKRRKLQPLYLLTVIISALPMTRSAQAEQKKSSGAIWRQSIFCTSLKSKTVLPHPKNRKSYLGMSVGAVCLWRLTNTMRLGLTSLRSCMRPYPQKNTTPLWSQR